LIVRDQLIDYGISTNRLRHIEWLLPHRQQARKANVLATLLQENGKKVIFSRTFGLEKVFKIGSSAFLVGRSG